ncbi:MAG: hypothetical protein ACI4EV_00220 [Lachnospiraceae bacterium]
MEHNLQYLKEKIQAADAVLIGIGNELSLRDGREEDVKSAYEKIRELVENKNYFVISENDDNQLYMHEFDKKRVIALAKEDFEGEEGEKKWTIYNSWLMATMKKSLLLVELGVGFQNPNAIRWPFERITFIGSGAYLIRIHRMFSQVDEKIKDKSESIAVNSLEFLIEK